MNLQGLDRAAAPTPAQATAMLAAIGGSWWNVYMGGPRSGGSGWTPSSVESYVAAGIGGFMLTYVGRQDQDVLTADLGAQDGAEACGMAAAFGYPAAPGAPVPICLDLEGRTYKVKGEAALDYAEGWCDAVRAGGFRSGVYSNPFALLPLAGRPQPPDFVWVASWVAHGPKDLDPYKAEGIPEQLWSGTGQRAWQYAGGPAVVEGLSVDISVADAGCLAGNPGAIPPPPAPIVVPPELVAVSVSLPTLAQGSAGQPVKNAEALLLAHGFGPAGLLDSSHHPDGIYGSTMATAVSAFQQAQQLGVTGVVDGDTWHALLAAQPAP
jgi:Domain of unknown function (DUF1906)/Putative peptidoglycan binding domain